MSGSGKKNQKNTTETQEKVLTRYDLKVQRRMEEKKREERNKRIASAVGILALIGLACWLISFPVRSWMTLHNTYVIVAGEKVTKVEFDYNYYTVLNNFISTNGYMLSLMGLDLSGDLSEQMYSDTLTWKDYFDEMALNNLLTGKAMRKDMETAGFTYDESEDYENFVAALREAAEETGISFKEYLKEFYGPYATLGRVESYIRQDLKVSAYLEAVADDNPPTDDEIQAYYEDNKNSFDCVDYHILTVYADLPTEPTELADPVEKTDEASSDDGEEAYTPSQAEIDAAMAIAKAEAEELQKTVATEGEAHTNVTLSSLNYQVSAWLADSERKKGDTTVIEVSYNHSYYVVSFDDRYIDSTLSADVRVILTADGNGQEILDEWAAGEASEDSFARLADQYNVSYADIQEGGLIKGLAPNQLAAELAAWLSDETRKHGDTAAITPEGYSNSYIFYYVGTGEPVWKVTIRNTLIAQFKSDYVSSLTEGLTVEDPHHNLNYLKVRAEQEAAAAAAENDGNDSEDGAMEDSTPE